MHANYHVSQKIWHLESDEQLNALIDIEDAPLNGDYVIAWQPLPQPYKPNICTADDCPINDGNECPAAEGCAGYEPKGECEAR